MLVSCSGSPFASDNSVRLWDVGTGKELKKLEGHRCLHVAKRCEFSMGWLYASPAQRGRGVDDHYIRVPFTYVFPEI